MNHRYDAFGRAATIDVGAQVVERYAYDGFDRMVRQQKWNTAGVHQGTMAKSFDPFDRTTSQSVTVTTAPVVSTRFTYVGMSDQVAVEEQANTAGTYEVSKAYSYGPTGEPLSLVDTPVNASTTKKVFYGANPHGDVESLTDAVTGVAASTYRYTAYGTADKKGTTGGDAITGDPVKDADLVNPYRFGGKRFEGATGSYDMGFRDYNPSLNRFLRPTPLSSVLAAWTSRQAPVGASTTPTGGEGLRPARQRFAAMSSGRARALATTWTSTVTSHSSRIQL